MGGRYGFPLDLKPKTEGV